MRENISLLDNVDHRSDCTERAVRYKSTMSAKYPLVVLRAEGFSILLHTIIPSKAPSPSCSVESVSDLRTGVRWFDARVAHVLAHFRRLITVVDTGLIPLS